MCITFINIKYERVCVCTPATPLSSCVCVCVCSDTLWSEKRQNFVIYNPTYTTHVSRSIYYYIHNTYTYDAASAAMTLPPDTLVVELGQADIIIPYRTFTCIVYTSID